MSGIRTLKRQKNKRPLLGVVYSDNYKLIGTGNNSTFGTFITATRGANYLTFTRTSSPGTSYCGYYYNNFISCTENFIRQVIFQIPTKTPNSLGYGIGVRSSVSSILVNFNSADSTNPNSGKLQWHIATNDNTINVVQRSTGVMTFNANDIFVLVLTKISALVYFAELYNTTNGSYLSDTMSLLDLNYPQTYIKPSTQYLSSYIFGETAYVYKEDTYVLTQKRPYYCGIGDSITFGNFGGSLAARFTNQIGNLNKNKSFVCDGGPGDKASDLLLRVPYLASLQARYYGILIGNNDDIAATNVSTFTATYTSIINGLRANGKSKVVLFLLPPRTVSTTINSVYNPAITALGASLDCKVVDTYTPFLSAGTINPALYVGDLTHFNSTGEDVFTNTVISAVPEII